MRSSNGFSLTFVYKTSCTVSICSFFCSPRLCSPIFCHTLPCLPLRSLPLLAFVRASQLHRCCRCRSKPAHRSQHQHTVQHAPLCATASYSHDKCTADGLNYKIVAQKKGHTRIGSGAVRNFHCRIIRSRRAPNILLSRRAQDPQIRVAAL